MLVRIILASVFAGLILTSGCSSSNDCQSLASALCSYDSYKTDKVDTVAKSRQDWCTCVDKGADALDNDYQKLACKSGLEQSAELNAGIESDAKQLEACRVQRAVLDQYKDTYIKTCIQTGGEDDCSAQLKKCSDACYAGTSGGTKDDETACLKGCDLTYPCGDMCS